MQTPDFHPTEEAKPLSWLVAETQDPSGNTITFDYVDEGDGELLLDAINYTGYQGSDGDRHVKFTYEDRIDVSTSYMAGGKSRTTKRLTQISTEYSTAVVREYNLGLWQPQCVIRSKPPSKC